MNELALKQEQANEKAGSWTLDNSGAEETEEIRNKS
jgi:hypothetical protein